MHSPYILLPLTEQMDQVEPRCPMLLTCFLILATIIMTITTTPPSLNTCQGPTWAIGPSLSLDSSYLPIILIS